MAHKLQGNPGEITWHEGQVSQPDSNTPSGERKNGQEPVTGINLLGNISLQIGKAQNELENTNSKIGQLARAIERNTPVGTRLVSVGVCQSGVSLVLDLGSPDQGTFWEVSSLAIGGTEVNVTAAGKWGLYISSVPNVNGAGLSNCVDIGVVASSAMPYSATYGSGQIIVHDAEHVFAVIFAGTAGQQYVANVQVRVYNTIASEGSVTYSV